MLLFTVVANPRLIRRAQSWVDSGWSGADADAVKAVDYIATDMHAHGQESAAIGYAKDDDPFLPKFNVIDKRYKVGADFDFLLSSRHHLANLNQCAEGFSSRDIYRIVQLNPQTNQQEADFDVGLRGFQMLRRFWFVCSIRAHITGFDSERSTALSSVGVRRSCTENLHVEYALPDHLSPLRLQTNRDGNQLFRPILHSVLARFSRSKTMTSYFSTNAMARKKLSTEPWTVFRRRSWNSP
jgi:hypothetical protein